METAALAWVLLRLGPRLDPSADEGQTHAIDDHLTTKRSWP